MATARQIEANRRNAQKSTGPRTAEGKAASRMNALRHGLASVHVHENAAEFQEFRASLVQTWMPANAKEMMLVDLIADGWWRMARSNRYESELLANEIEEMKRRNRLPTRPHPRDDRGVALMMAQEQYDRAFKTLFRYSDRASSKYFRALEQLEKMQRARRRDEQRGASPIPRGDHAAMIPLPVAEGESELASFGEAQPFALERSPEVSTPAHMVNEAPAAAPESESGSFGASATATAAGAASRHDDSDPVLARGPARGLSCAREIEREHLDAPVGKSVSAPHPAIPTEAHIGYNLRNV
jgi:hypothetical protein